MGLESCARVWRLTNAPGTYATLAGEDGLDVDDGSAVDHLDGLDAQAMAANFANGDGMKSERVRAVGRARGEHAPEPFATVVSRMDFEHFAMALVQPGDDEELVAYRDAAQSCRRPRINLEPSGGSAFRPLARSFVAVLERRANDPDGPKRKATAAFCWHTMFLRRNGGAGKSIWKPATGGAQRPGNDDKESEAKCDGDMPYGVAHRRV